MAKWKCAACLAAMLVSVVLGSVAQEAASGKATATAPQKTASAAVETTAKAATYRVQKEPFKIEVTLKGMFEAAEMTEVAIHTDEWTGLTVKKAVEHGAKVSRGDTLVWLNMEKIDRAIRELQADSYLADVNVKQAEEDVRILEKSTPQDLALAERAKRMADEDLHRFLSIDRPNSEKRAHFSVKSARNFLEYEQEELNQLEKMYKADDLTEATEEIILKRQRDSVEQATFRLQNVELDREHTLQLDLPRREQAANDAVQKQAIALEKAQTLSPLTLSSKRLALEKLKYDREKSAERLAKLRRDREAMSVTAPTDGIVYYGKCVRGQWTTATTIAAKLQPNGAVTSDEVLVTIVKPRPLFVRAAVEEKDLQHVRCGVRAKAVAVAFSDVRIPARVESVSAIPIAPGSFEAKLALDPAADAESLMAGMACTLKLVSYEKADALTVPPVAVFTDELDDEKRHVFVAGPNGKPEKRPVKVGKQNDKKVEIVEGAREGDEVLLENPEKKS